MVITNYNIDLLWGGLIQDYNEVNGNSSWSHSLSCHFQCVTGGRRVNNSGLSDLPVTPGITSCQDNLPSHLQLPSGTFNPQPKPAPNYWPQGSGGLWGHWLAVASGLRMLHSATALMRSYSPGVAASVDGFLERRIDAWMKSPAATAEDCLRCDFPFPASNSNQCPVIASSSLRTVSIPGDENAGSCTREKNSTYTKLPAHRSTLTWDEILSNAVKKRWSLHLSTIFLHAILASF